MNNITVTVKMKKFKLKAFASLANLVAVFHLPTAWKMRDWQKDNIDKFYTLKR